MIHTPSRGGSQGEEPLVFPFYPVQRYGGRSRPVTPIPPEACLVSDCPICAWRRAGLLVPEEQAGASTHRTAHHEGATPFPAEGYPVGYDGRTGTRTHGLLDEQR